MTSSQPNSLCSIPIQKDEVIKVYSAPATIVYATSLVEVLNELGFKARLVRTLNATDLSLHILLCAQTIPFEFFPPNYIVWQFEQVNSNHWTDYYLYILKNAKCIWDYCEENCIKYSHLNPNIRMVPPGWHKSIGTDTGSNRDIEFLFYGLMNDRRNTILNRLKSVVPIKIVTSAHGKDLSDLLNRTKTVINLHFYENAVLETPRIIQSFAHGCSVISETSINRSELDQYIDFFEDSSLEKMLNVIKKNRTAPPNFEADTSIHLISHVEKLVNEESSDSTGSDEPRIRPTVLVTSAAVGSRLLSVWKEQVSSRFDITINRLDDRNEPTRENAMHPRLQGKIPKMLAWETNPGYDYYVWIDSTFSIDRPDSIDWLVNQCRDHQICLFKHSQRSGINEELNFMNRLMQSNNQYLINRYRNEKLNDQVSTYLSDPEFIDDKLFECGIFVYSKDAVKNREFNLLKEWFYHNCIWSVQDQLSVPYLLTKFKSSYRVLGPTIFTTGYFTYDQKYSLSK